MFYTKRLLLLAICVISFGSASDSQYLAYSIDNPSTEEFFDRHIQKEDQGFNIESEISPSHPKPLEQLIEVNDMSIKSYRSYTAKSAYY